MASQETRVKAGTGIAWMRVWGSENMHVGSTASLEKRRFGNRSTTATTYFLFFQLILSDS